MRRNPVPILYSHCGIKVSTISRLFPNGTPLEQVHATFTDKPIDDRLHGELFNLTMAEWGVMHDRHVKQALWDCYFPHTLPHIYHRLVFEHNQENAIVKVTRCTQRMLAAILRQPKLKQLQLRMVARYAMVYTDTLSSKHRKRGPDSRYMALHRALHDPQRMYQKGEIVAD